VVKGPPGLRDIEFQQGRHASILRENGGRLLDRICRYPGAGCRLAVNGAGMLYTRPGMPDSYARRGGFGGNRRGSGLRLALVCHFTFALRAEALESGQTLVK